MQLDLWSCSLTNMPPLLVMPRVRNFIGSSICALTLIPVLGSVVEALLGMHYVHLAHQAHSPSAALVGFAAAVATLTRMLLCGLQELSCSAYTVLDGSTRAAIMYATIRNGYAALCWAPLCEAY
jgi:hypothetical protein